MRRIVFSPVDELKQQVTSIWSYEQEDPASETRLPFFADGYPGLIYQDAAAMCLQPGGKALNNLFLYGQTMAPIELVARGAFRMIVFQLKPDALGRIFQVDAAALKDECMPVPGDHADFLQQLTDARKRNSGAQEEQTEIALLSTWLLEYSRKATPAEPVVLAAIDLMLASGGTMPIADIRQRLNISERRLQRLFLRETGISPKQFAKIIQFQRSIKALPDPSARSGRRSSALTAVAYELGFADQSHFIRRFRQYTGFTPTAWLKESGKPA